MKKYKAMNKAEKEQAERRAGIAEGICEDTLFELREFLNQEEWAFTATELKTQLEKAYKAAAELEKIEAVFN